MLRVPQKSTSPSNGAVARVITVKRSHQSNSTHTADLMRQRVESDFLIFTAHSEIPER